MQFPVRLVARRTPGCMMWLSPVLALGLTVLFGAILFAMLGKDPLNALYVFLIAPLETLRGWAEVGVKMTPLLLCAAGLVVCFRASIWNIGAEGQFLAGAISGGWAALACPDGIGHWYLVIVLLAGIAGGAFWGGITALLKDKFNANEILVSLMLVYVAQFGLAYCVQGPLQDPDGLGFPQSALFASAASMPVILGGTRLHLGSGRTCHPGDDGAYVHRLSAQGFRHGAFGGQVRRFPSEASALGLDAHFRWSGRFGRHCRSCRSRRTAHA